MTTKKTKPNESSDLRSRAEELLKDTTICSAGSNNASDEVRLLHELQVHEIELEMQNEELMRTKREAEQALAKYSDLYEFAPIGLFTLDTHSQILEVNLMGAMLLGMERRFLLNRRFEKFVVPEDRHALGHFCDQAFRTGVKQTCELRLIKVEGPEVYVRIEGTATNDSMLNDRRFGLAVIDITERKLAENALKQAQTSAEEDLKAMSRLQQLGTLSFREKSLQPLLLEIIDAALAISRADFGNIQLLDKKTGDLNIVAQRGFPDWWVDYWNNVGNAQGSCATALKRGEHVIVEDVEQSPEFAGKPSLEIQLKAGVRACQSTPLIDRSGRPLGVFSTHYRKPHRPDDRTLRLMDLLGRQAADIIEHKMAEEALEENQTVLKTITESTPDFISVKDREGRYVMLNSAAAENLRLSAGMSAEEVLGKKDDEILSPEVASKVTKDDSLVITSGEVRAFDQSFVIGDELRTFSTIKSPYRDSAGNIVGVANVSRDITERKNSEEALREAKDYLENLIDHANAPIIVWDTSFKINRFNRAFEQLTGFKASEVLGQPLHILFPEDSRDESLKHIKDTLQGEQWDSVEIPIKAAKGAVRTILWNSANIFNQDKTAVIATIAQGQDITERKQLELELEMKIQQRTSELQGAKTDLEAANEHLQKELKLHDKLEADLIISNELAQESARSKAAFLANMSHELRTPMNAVIGFTSLLLEDDLSSEQKEYVEGIRSGGEAMMSLINDVLEFSRTDKEKVELEHQPFSLRHCIESSLDMVASSANQKGLKLSYTISYGTPDSIIGDHGRLRQVLVNLLGNAVKFTDEGKISVTVSSKKIEGNKRQILFSVKDTGIGIPPDKLSEIFKPFTQLERVISRKREGVGLGLAISKRLVELMGGEIWAESNPGQGTTFYFTVQAEVGAGEIPSEKPSDAALLKDLTGLKPMSILVAEDNPSNQRVLVQMLKRLGYRPDVAASGKEVIQALEFRPYDLILMDVRMPEMDGITATKVIRELGMKNQPRIVAITAYALEGDREKCLDAGMDGYIAKPVMMGELVEVLKKCSQKAQ
jgi:PAS domain S-box-containing protein